MLVLIIIIVIAVIALLYLMLLYGIYKRVFYNTDAFKTAHFKLPDTDQYRPLTDEMNKLIHEVESADYEEIRIKSFDGLSLYGRYHHVKDNAPTHIQFHGYRGAAPREFAGSKHCEWELECNTLMVDMRSHGKSGGNRVTFGIKERYDAVSWANYAYERFGPDTPLILSGISMGGASVLMASELILPPSVCGIVTDSPYDSPKDVIMNVIERSNAPKAVAWGTVYLSALLFAHIRLTSVSSSSAVSKSDLPVLIYQGDADMVVPYESAYRIQKAAKGHCEVHIFKGSPHGISYLFGPERYVDIMRKFVFEVCKKAYGKKR